MAIVKEKQKHPIIIRDGSFNICIEKSELFKLLKNE